MTPEQEPTIRSDASAVGQPATSPPSPVALDALLVRCSRVATTNPRAALALARLLKRTYPDDPRLDPLLAQLEPPPVPPAHRAAVSSPPYTPPPIRTLPLPASTGGRRRGPAFWQLLLIGSVIVALMGVAITNGALPDLALQSDPQRSVGDLLSPAPTALIIPTPALPAAAPLPTLTPAPPYQPRPIAPGKILSYGLWQGTLALPEHAQWLDEPLTGVTPQGRLLVAVVMMSNLTSDPRPMPPDLFVLVDQQMNFYRPLPGASSRFLESFGRGVVGDLALEDAIPAGGGLVSVPLLFDVPADQQGFVLMLGEYNDTGWQLQP